MNNKPLLCLRLRQWASLGLTFLGLLAATAPAVTVTFVWQTSNLETAADPLISANGYFSLDSSLFDSANSNQTIYFRTDTNVNVTAFHFEFVTLHGATQVVDTFGLSNISAFAGARFDSTTNPPVWIDALGEYTADGNNETLSIAGESLSGQICELGGYNDCADGTFIATNSAATTDNTTPTNLVFAVSGMNLNLSWPADHIGWRLLSQTNHLANGISVNTNDWGTVANSASTNQLTIPMNLTNPTEFFRLVYP
jgi:hypothetical protein